MGHGNLNEPRLLMLQERLVSSFVLKSRRARMPFARSADPYLERLRARPGFALRPQVV